MRTLLLLACLAGGLMSAAAIANPANDSAFDRALKADRAKDYATSFPLWMKLAKAGGTAAEYNLALAFELGQGTSKDLSQARLWFEKAAKQGDGDAAYRLMVLYGDNLGRIQFDSKNATIRDFLHMGVYCSPLDVHHPDRRRLRVSVRDVLHMLASDVQGNRIETHYAVSVRHISSGNVVLVEATTYGLYYRNHQFEKPKKMYPHPFDYLYAITVGSFSPLGAYMDTKNGPAPISEADYPGPAESLAMRRGAFCGIKARHYLPLVRQHG